MDHAQPPTAPADQPVPPSDRPLAGLITPRRRLFRSAADWAVVAAVLAVIVGTIALKPSRPAESTQAWCANRLRQIGLACIMYASENGGRYPPTVNDIQLTQEITPEVFVCPVSNDTRAAGPTTAAVAANLTAGGHLSYSYVGGGLTSADANLAQAVVAYEPVAKHDGTAGMNVVYGDAHVEWHDARTGAKIAAELNAGHNPPRAEKLR